MKKILLAILFIAGVILLSYLVWGKDFRSEERRKVEGIVELSNDRVVAFNGLHSHPELRIFVDNKPVTIPEDIGLDPDNLSEVHTHGDLPVIHLEFKGEVHESDITLGKFFEVWEKDFYSFGKDVRMVVNGKENTQYENYVMQHEDDIVLYYTN